MGSQGRAWRKRPAPLPNNAALFLESVSVLRLHLPYVRQALETPLTAAFLQGNTQPLHASDKALRKLFQPSIRPPLPLNHSPSRYSP